MDMRSLYGICIFLVSLVLLSYVPTSMSVSLDVSDLRNKVSKIKVNPRRSLWATGHFMGKKSMSNGAVGDLHSRMKHAEPQVGNMDKLITHAALQVALQALLEDTQDSKILPNRARLCAKCLKGY
ncbi:neuromedin Ba isoform X1 [Trichomycterus rosablanca]|uniref:neuromedin Ba isoform X1 n=1 Tax=Trichomycterus rosablanca TaxID=2290929 RepID=UPI002F34F226